MSIVVILLVGLTAGMAVTVIDALIGPVVYGWRADRRARAEARRMQGRDHDPLGPIEAMPSTATAALGTRLINNLVATALITAIVVAIHLAGLV